MQLQSKFTLSALAGLAILPLGGWVNAQDTPETEITSDPAAIETFGWMVSKQCRAIELNFTEEEIEIFLKGLKAGLTDGKEMDSRSEDLEKMGEYLTGRAGKINAAKAAEAKKATVAYFEELDKDPEIKKSDSGLRYKILKEGEGPKATKDQSVTVHYKGTLIDGTQFDSSIDRGQPATFGVSGVVPGFSEGVQLTGVGGKVIIYMPSELGYGDNPRPGGKIKPGDALIFEVEMIGIQ